MNKLLAFAVVVAATTGCHRKYVTTEKYPPVFAPANPLAAYKSSQTGYPLKSPRASNDADFRDPIFAPSDGIQPDTFLRPASATEPLAPPLVPPLSPVSAPAPPPAAQTAGPPQQMQTWVSGEFLLWATRGVGLPPLVTNGTSAVFGDERVLNGSRSGLRVEGGTWLDDTRNVGVMARFYTLGTQAVNLAGGSNGTNTVTLPQQLNILGTVAQVPIFVGFPGLTRGTVTASASTQFMGGDASLLHELTASEAFSVNALVGYRYLHLGDKIGRSFDVVPTPAVEALLGATARAMGEDQTRTRNNFHGGQVGFALGTESGRVTFALQSSVALGVTSAELDVSRTRSIGAGTVTAVNAIAALAGLTAPPPNTAVTPVVQTGARSEEDFLAVVPEVGLQLGFRASESVHVTGGYNFLYWSKVRRAQEQFDLSPTPTGTTTSFWAHGVSVGVNVRY